MESVFAQIAPALSVINTVVFLGVSTAFAVAFLVIYSWITPYDELEMIRSDNLAAAYSLGGALVAFILPLNAVVRHSHSLWELTVWALISLIIQLGVYAVIHFTMRDMERRMRQGDVAPGAFRSEEHTSELQSQR